MKNKIIVILIFLFFSSYLKAENLLIQSKKISLEKKSEISIFEDDVVITTSENNIIKSDYAKYNKKDGIIILKKNIRAIDNKNNEIRSDHAIYNENFKTLESVGLTEIITAENYVIKGKDIIFDNLNKTIHSEKKTIITDTDKNKIFLNNFEYLINKSIFKSIGDIKVEDNFENIYNFSQIYIDTKKRNCLGQI